MQVVVKLLIPGPLADRDEALDAPLIVTSWETFTVDVNAAHNRCSFGSAGRIG